MQEELAERISASEPDYILGHSEPEIQRLQRQEDILDPITNRLLHEAGIVPGMRILDIGCVAVAVSFLAGRLMGNSGHVVGVDANPAVLAIARARAESAGIRNVEFIESPIESFYDEKAFDAVVGRFVLILVDLHPSHAGWCCLFWQWLAFSFRSKRKSSEPDKKNKTHRDTRVTHRFWLVSIYPACQQTEG